MRERRDEQRRREREVRQRQKEREKGEEMRWEETGGRRELRSSREGGRERRRWDRAKDRGLREKSLDTGEEGEEVSGAQMCLNSLVNLLVKLLTVNKSRQAELERCTLGKH